MKIHRHCVWNQEAQKQKQSVRPVVAKSNLVVAIGLLSNGRIYELGADISIILRHPET